MKEVLSLKQAVLATLHYFDILDFPLTLEELERYLYGWSAPVEAIDSALREIPSIHHAHGFYFLEGRQEIAELRKERQGVAEFLWRRVERFRFFLELCPFVRLVAVCNTLAYGNVKESSDIDLFIITKDGKLATARFFMKFFTQIFGMRAHHEKIARRFCLSFFVTEGASNLKLLAHPFDPHLAYFVKTMVPLFGEVVYRDWLHLNESWVSPYFKRPLEPRRARLKSSMSARILRFFFESFLRLFGNRLENFLFNYQAKRDLAHRKKFPHSKGIVMNQNVFKFHEEDPREEIAKQFLERVRVL